MQRCSRDGDGDKVEKLIYVLQKQKQEQEQARDRGDGHRCPRWEGRRRTCLGRCGSSAPAMCFGDECGRRKDEGERWAPNANHRNLFGRKLANSPYPALKLPGCFSTGGWFRRRPFVWERRKSMVL